METIATFPASRQVEKQRRSLLFPLLSIPLTVGIFAYLFSSMSVDEVVDFIATADIRGVAAFFVLSLGMSFFRCWRYLLLLRISGFAPSRAAMFLVVLVRNLFADLLPARLGTLVYIFLVRTRLGVPFEAACSSFAYAFLFDLLAIVPMILLAILFVGGEGLVSLPALMATVMVFGGVVIAITVNVSRLMRFFVRLLRFVPGFSLRRTLMRQCQLISVELERTRDAGVFWRLLILSILVRLAKYGALYMFLFALLAPRGYAFGDLPPARVFLGICAAEFSASTPISGIAGFGLYQGTWFVVFQLLGFPEHIARVTSISHHLFTQVYGYSLGGLALGALLLPWFRVRVMLGRDEHPLEAGFATRLSGSLAAVFALLIGLFVVSTPHAVSRPSDAPTSAEREALRALGTRLPAIVLFDSNRSGTFGIHALDLRTGEFSAVVDDGVEHEMYPDVSPDGTRVVFARQRSTAKRSPSDIWIAAVDGSEVRKLAADGTFPTFSADGRLVYFERARQEAMAYDLQRGEEVRVFPRGDGWRWEVVKPRVSPDGRFVAFTSDREGRWNAWYAEISSGRAEHIAAGCEPTWAGDGGSVVWVSTRDVRERSGFYRFERATGAKSAFQDRGAPFGHEYFGSFAPAERYFLYASCPPGEHEHVTGNYQLFILDRERHDTLRLTFDIHTNRWPKILMPAKGAAD